MGVSDRLEEPVPDAVWPLGAVVGGLGGLGVGVVDGGEGAFVGWEDLGRRGDYEGGKSVVGAGCLEEVELAKARRMSSWEVRTRPSESVRGPWREGWRWKGSFAIRTMSHGSRWPFSSRNLAQH